MNNRFALRVEPDVVFGILSFALAVAVGLIIIVLPARLISVYTFFLAGLGGLLFVCVTFLLAKRRIAHSTATSLPVALLTWWFLLVSEGFFVRSGSVEAVLEGEYSLAAYSEAIVWVLASFILLMYSMSKPQYLLGMFAGSHKWLSLFALLAVLSVSYSPNPLFSLVWAFKLCLIVLLLQFCSTTMRELKDMHAFFRATFWAFVLLTLAPLAQAFTDAPTLFAGGRLGGLFAPTGVSAAAALMLVLSLIFYQSEGRKYILFWVALSSAMMILGGGKVAIGAGIISGIAFFLFQKKVGSALAFLALILSLGLISIRLFPPLVEYLQRYQESGLFFTLTGRVGLWMAAIEGIQESLIWGHGYVASKFVSLQLGALRWPAGHMHNAFLEVLYNNGLVGLILIVSMNVVILKNLTSVIKEKAGRDAKLLAVGSLAMYTNLLLNGFFTASFGGRPHSGFMVFLALVVLSEKLRKGLPHGRTEADRLHDMRIPHERLGAKGTL